MLNSVFSAVEFNTNRFHRSAADGGAITRVYINMLAPEAFRTMVRVAVPQHEEPALIAGKVLARSLEFLCRGHLLPSIQNNPAHFCAGRVVRCHLAM